MQPLILTPSSFQYLATHRFQDLSTTTRHLACIHIHSPHHVSLRSGPLPHSIYDYLNYLGIGQYNTSRSHSDPIGQQYCKIKPSTLTYSFTISLSLTSVSPSSSSFSFHWLSLGSITSLAPVHQHTVSCI